MGGSPRPISGRSGSHRSRDRGDTPFLRLSPCETVGHLFLRSHRQSLHARLFQSTRASSTEMGEIYMVRVGYYRKEIFTGYKQGDDVPCPPSSNEKLSGSRRCVP